MMNTNESQLDWLLHTVAATGEHETDEATCVQTRETLAVYVEGELVGQQVVLRYPTIARHLAVCPECQDAYLSLRELLVAFAAEIASTETATPSLRWTLPQRLSTLHQKTRRGQDMRSASVPLEQEPFQIPVVALGQNVTLELWVAFEADDDLLDIVGSFPGGHVTFSGAKARLYRLLNPDTFQVELATDTALTVTGNFAFQSVAAESYVLTILLSDNELAMTWIDQAVWRPD